MPQSWSRAGLYFSTSNRFQNRNKLLFLKCNKAYFMCVVANSRAGVSHTIFGLNAITSAFGLIISAQSGLLQRHAIGLGVGAVTPIYGLHVFLDEWTLGAINPRPFLSSKTRPLLSARLLQASKLLLRNERLGRTVRHLEVYLGSLNIDRGNRRCCDCGVDGRLRKEILRRTVVVGYSDFLHGEFC